MKFPFPFKLNDHPCVSRSVHAGRNESRLSKWSSGFEKAQRHCFLLWIHRHKRTPTIVDLQILKKRSTTMFTLSIKQRWTFLCLPTAFTKGKYKKNKPLELNESLFYTTSHTNHAFVSYFLWSCYQGVTLRRMTDNQGI